MTKRFIIFLAAHKYGETTYIFDNKAHTTHYVADTRLRRPDRGIPYKPGNAVNQVDGNCAIFTAAPETPQR
ncbi:MAG: hypothetical protein ACE5GZ_07985 [Gammaproteobacteria bacterium]